MAVCMAGTPGSSAAERLFQIYPTFGQGSDFIAIEVPNSKGLFMRWCLCVGKKGVYFRSRDGIYRTAGGAPDSITDAQLYSLFPHESATSCFCRGWPEHKPEIVWWRLLPSRRHARKTRNASSTRTVSCTTSYIGQDEDRRTLVFNEETDSWVSRDTYTPTFVDALPGRRRGGLRSNQPMHGVVCGADDGNLVQLRREYVTTMVRRLSGRIRTRACDQNDPRPRKLYGDILLDFDSVCETMDVTAGFDNYTFLLCSDPYRHELDRPSPFHLGHRCRFRPIRCEYWLRNRLDDNRLPRRILLLGTLLPAATGSHDPACHGLDR